MAFAPPEPPDDDAERVALALAQVMRPRLHALFALSSLTPKDRELIDALERRDPRTLTLEHRHWVQRLLWKYRRDIPRELQPKLNPDDPIVREMELAGV